MERRQVVSYLIELDYCSSSNISFNYCEIAHRQSVAGTRFVPKLLTSSHFEAKTAVYYSRHRRPTACPAREFTNFFPTKSSLANCPLANFPPSKITPNLGFRTSVARYMGIPRNLHTAPLMGGRGIFQGLP